MVNLLKQLESIDPIVVFDNLSVEIHIWHILRDEIGDIKTWRLLYANGPALKTWGFKSLEQIEGKTADVIFGVGTTSHYLPVVKKIIAESAPHSFTDYFKLLDKQFLFTSIPFGDYFITTGNDITEYIEERQEIQHNNRELVAKGRALVESKERFQQLYDSSEVSIWDEDFSGVFNFLNQLRRQGIDDLRRYLKENSSKIEEIARMIKINSVNKATLKLFKAGNQSEILDSIHKVFGLAAEDIFVEQLVAIWEGKTFFSSDVKLAKLNGELFDAYLSMPLPITEKGCKHLPVSIFDISERKQAQERLRYQASHDGLTGLINRYEFEQRVTRVLATVAKDKAKHAMCFLDLDQFKIINDTCGHSVGDELLRQVSRLLQKTIRNRDTIARLGGDEFGVLMEHCTVEQAKRVSRDILNAVTNFHFVWSGSAFRISVSIGLVEIAEDSEGFTELLKQADSACYLAKESGRNQVRFHLPDDIHLAERYGQMKWVARIRQAIDEDQLCLFAQPINSLENDELRHYELLIRMKAEDGAMIPPNSFLPAALRYNIIENLDRWVVRHACQMLQDHPLFVDKIDFVSINLSGASFTNPNAMQSILDILKETGLPPEKICFEVTETMAISNLKEAVDFMEKIKALGCRFALDDFGSGISSFGYLKTLPVDYLKIDGVFVKDIVEDPIDLAMVKSINEIGQVMGMKTIAEFVENDEIKMKLKTIGVNYGQGYGLGKPVPLTDLLAKPQV